MKLLNIPCLCLCLILLCTPSLLSCQKQSATTDSTQAQAIASDTLQKKSIAEELAKHNDEPIAVRIAHYLKLKKEQPESYNFDNEDEMTMYGYRHLWDNKPDDALEIFKLIVQQFPNSANPYDSLGEAYLVLGDSVLALKNYQKSLSLNPDNFAAVDQVELIQFPHTKKLTSEEKFSKIYSKQAYLSDLDQLAKKLIEVNPSSLKFISEEAFWKTVEEKKALITDTTTYAEFVWHCSEIIANVNCSHTSLGEFFPDDNRMIPKTLKFPLQTRWIQNSLVVEDPLSNGSTVAKKEEITTINGVSVDQLLEEIFKHIPSQGHIETSKPHYFNRRSSELIAYALNFPTTYEVVLKGDPRTIRLRTSENIPTPYRNNSIPFTKEPLDLEIHQPSNTAILTIASFNYYPWNNLDYFQEFIDESFKKMEANKIKNLLIDVRFNGGGSADASIYLLKYLVDTPFTYFTTALNSVGHGAEKPYARGFKGKVSFLIDGMGKSTTGHFIAKVKELHLGAIVGEELGSNQFCTAGQTICRLSNTKLVFNVANTVSRLLNTPFPDETGILPDHVVSQSITDYFNKEDMVKKYALALMN